MFSAFIRAHYQLVFPSINRVKKKLFNPTLKKQQNNQKW